MDKFILSYDDKDQVLYLKILGLMDSEGLRELLPRFQKLLEGKPRRYVLVDMSESVQLDASFMTKELRNSYKELMNQMDSDKGAIIGASPALRMIAKIALAVSGRSDTTKFFKTKEEALCWLKE
ncbi:STAS/SEC14 domain-containing protein [candidate division WOR-3 bacterium]|nr:STAS/SEC14 domain-containing protein [candidate division WOR-3 bacterium]